MAAEQAITGLPKKTSSGISAADYFIGIDAAEGYQVLVKDIGDYISQNAPSLLLGSRQTVANALTELNSKKATLG